MNLHLTQFPIILLVQTVFLPHLGGDCGSISDHAHWLIYWLHSGRSFISCSCRLYWALCASAFSIFSFCAHIVISSIRIPCQWYYKCSFHIESLNGIRMAVCLCSALTGLDIFSPQMNRNPSSSFCRKRVQSRHAYCNRIPLCKCSQFHSHTFFFAAHWRRSRMVLWFCAVQCCRSFVLLFINEIVKLELYLMMSWSLLLRII